MRKSVLLFLFTGAFGLAAPVAHAQTRAKCDLSLKLPKGFCAVVFADSIWGARHIAVAPNGDVFVATNTSHGVTGGVVALRDTTRDGKADVLVRFGPAGGSGIALRKDQLYFATNTAVLRFLLPAGSMQPITTGDTLVRDLPAAGGHVAKTIALGRGSDIFVNIGSRTNSCQVKDREENSPGNNPCTELETRAGIWRFNVERKGQTQRDGTRYVTGLRNVVALTAGPDGVPFGLQHGRDQLAQNWGKYFTEAQSAEKPAEIFVRMKEGDNYGWPYCFFDRQQNKHVLAPEYGGDGQQTGRCALIKAPIASFPGHWAPNGVAFYTGTRFPARYRGGAFIAFHGSWNRAPLPQGGFKVVFVPMKAGKVTGKHDVFADGFAGVGPILQPGTAKHRPTGLTVSPDGSLYITDDAGGRIWRVSYRAK